MSDVFGQSYAGAYDDIYRDKDYEAECDVVESVFASFGEGVTRSILDLGCGTGNHASPLAARGYDVVGIDRSEAMLAIARQKATDGVRYELGDIRSVGMGRQFDAVLILFAVLGYQTSNTDVNATLRNAAAHLRPGGLLLFDVWNGPAVLHERPTARMKITEAERGCIIRFSSGALDPNRHLCTVDYHLWHLDGDRVVAESREQHAMRFFYPLELELFLEGAGLSLARLGSFPDYDRDADETTWNVIAIARKPGAPKEG